MGTALDSSLLIPLILLCRHWSVGLRASRPDWRIPLRLGLLLSTSHGNRATWRMVKFPGSFQDEEEAPNARFPLSLSLSLSLSLPKVILLLKAEL